MKVKRNRKKILLILNISIVVLILLNLIILISGGFSLSLFGLKIRVYSFNNPALILIILIILKLIFDKGFRKKTEKVSLPSYGFIFLVFVFMIFIIFFVWAIKEKWYDRIDTPRQKEQDIVKWDTYSKKIKEYKEKFIQKKIILDNKVKMRQLLRTLEKTKLRLNSHPNNLRLQKKLMLLNYMTGNKSEALKQAELFFKNRKPYASTLFVLFEDLWENPNMFKRKRLLKFLLRDDFPVKRIDKEGRINFFNLSPEFRTFNGIFINFKGNNIINFNINKWTNYKDPYIIFIRNNCNSNISTVLDLSCNIPDAWPVKVIIDTEQEKIIDGIIDTNILKIELPEVQKHSSKFFILKDNKIRLRKKLRKITKGLRETEKGIQIYSISIIKIEK